MLHSRWMAAAMVIGLVAGSAGPMGAQVDTRPGVAVLPFENGGSYGSSQEDYDALRRGIAGLLLSELNASASVRLVDRQETQRLLDEQSLGASGRVDAATAAQVGRLVGARYMITGTFIDLYGTFRLDARIIDVETGEILRTVRADPRLTNVQQLSRMVSSLSTEIMRETQLARLETSSSTVLASRPEVPAPARPTQPAPDRAAGQEVPTDALVLYSRALLYEDTGDMARAIEYYQKALEKFPGFSEAKEGLRKARGEGKPPGS